MTKIGIIGGSGLDDPKILNDYHEFDIETPYGKPSDKIIAGKIGDKEVFILARHGKGHTIPPSKVPFRANIRALKDLGCTHVLATTACGSLREEIKPREIVFIDQFIDFTKKRDLTFFDGADGKVVHTPMADPLDDGLRQLLIEVAEELKIPHHKKGTMVTIEGPRFSTRAESFMFQKLGADVINMSTVPEAQLARELDMRYASIAMSTDYDCWKEGEEPVTFEIVLKNMAFNAENAKKLLLAVIPKI